MPRKKRRILPGRRLEVDPTDAERARFYAKAKPGSVPENYDTRCLEWTAYTDGDGYGRFKYRGEVIYAHRWAYAADVGPVEVGFDIDHGCRNRCCVNTDHLEQRDAVEHRQLALAQRNGQ